MEDKIVRFDLADKIFKEMPQKAKLIVGNAQVELCFIGGLNVILRVFYFDGKSTRKKAIALGNDKEHIDLVLNSFDTSLKKIEKEIIGYEKDQLDIYALEGYSGNISDKPELESGKGVIKGSWVTADYNTGETIGLEGGITEEIEKRTQ